MKKLLLIAGGLIFIGVAISVAPDVYRYIKISSM
jgi:hypothetical protein